MDLKEQAAAVRRELDAKQAAAKEAWAKFAKARQDMVDSGVDLSKDKDAFGKLDDAGKAHDTIADEMKDLEARWARLVDLDRQDGDGDGKGDGRPGFLPGGGKGPAAPGLPAGRSVGGRLVSSEQWKSLKAGGSFENPDIPMGTTPGIKLLDRAELKTLITGTSDTSAGAFVEPDRQAGMVELARRPLVVSDLVNVGTTDSDLVEWVEQTSRTNAAAETAEAIATGDASGAAPESAAAWAVKNTDVRDLTHFMPATKRALADAGQVASLIDTELRDGVRERLDGQMVNGNGIAPNLRGVLNAAGILTQALGLDTRSDAIHKAITLIRLGFFEPTALLIHPSDWEQVVLEKDSTGTYVYGPPSAPSRSSIWGLTPVVSPVIAAGTGLVGDFRRGSTLWLREGLSVAMSDSHSDFFTRRMVAVLAVLRAAFATVRPTCFATVTGI
jgi:Phage capsid family.